VWVDFPLYLVRVFRAECLLRFSALSRCPGQGTLPRDVPPLDSLVTGNGKVRVKNSAGLQAAATKCALRFWLRFVHARCLQMLTSGLPDLQRKGSARQHQVVLRCWRGRPSPERK
jgi:hypothetical protein